MTNRYPSLLLSLVLAMVVGPSWSAEEPVEPVEEVLWRQVSMEDGSVVLIRDQLMGGDQVRISRDAYVVRGEEVVNTLPLDTEREVVEQISLTLGVQPLGGLAPSAPPQMATVIDYLERPRPDSSDFPSIALTQAPASGPAWTQVQLAPSRTVVFWDRMTGEGDLVRDAFLVERQAVSLHTPLDPAISPPDYAEELAVGDETPGPLEPANEPNVLIVTDYLEDFADLLKATTEYASVLESPAADPTNPGGDPVVSPSSGPGGP